MSATAVKCRPSRHTSGPGHPVEYWTVSALSAYVGGLSRPSKMPCYGYSIPATRCKVGSRLRTVAGSTCNHCYALKGRYAFPNVMEALERRYASLDSPLWANVMVELITRKGRPLFRWHDAGDVQSVEHLARIVAVCERTPDVAHWLPTREYATVREFVRAGGTFPPNLTIRLSAHMLGGYVPRFRDLQAHGVVVSSVDSTDPTATACSAPTTAGECRDCRACWSRNVPHVTYRKH